MYALYLFLLFATTYIRFCLHRSENWVGSEDDEPPDDVQRQEQTEQVAEIVRRDGSVGAHGHSDNDETCARRRAQNKQRKRGSENAKIIIIIINKT